MESASGVCIVAASFPPVISEGIDAEERFETSEELGDNLRIGVGFETGVLPNAKDPLAQSVLVMYEGRRIEGFRVVGSV